MSTELKEMQFELLPSPDAESGFVFGIGASVSIDDGGFLPGDDDWEDEDESNPRRGSTAFGRDTLLGPSWGFNLHINEHSVNDARTTLDAFRTEWRARHIRRTPGRVVALRYRLNDEYRRVYGRPRRFSAPPSNLILSGYVPVTTDFKCADAYTYEDTEHVETLSLQVGSAGGFIFPTTFPTTTVPSGSQTRHIIVGGDAETYPRIRFHGPVSNPSLATNDWILSLSPLNIPAGEYVDVDLRPWNLSFMLNGTSSVAGAVGRRQYLANMSLEPGPHMLTYRGTSVSGSATCEVRWSNARNSY